MKKILLNRLIASLLIAIYFITSFSNIAFAVDTTNIYTNEQEIIREVANAYYNKGIKSQYCSYRKSFINSPEEATSQHTIYNVCSNYLFSIYYQAFGVRIPFLTTTMLPYAQKYYDSNNIVTNDIIEYWQVRTDEDGNKIYEDNKGNKKDINLLTSAGRNSYATKLLTEYNLQVGDIICYFTEGSGGHAVVIYDIIYDESGQPIDALIRESVSKYDKSTTKITDGLSYAELINENNNIYEGSIQERYLLQTYASTPERKRRSIIRATQNASYFTIMRPLLKDKSGNYTGKYFYSTFKSANTTFGYECIDRTLTDYQITEASNQRLKYSGIDIEKTVDVFNNSVVNLGDTLEYTIKITNNSNTKYRSFDVVENISNYVDIVDTGNGTSKDNTLIWNIKSLNSNTSTEIKYRVKVKYDKDLLDKELVSTGTVAGIASSTVKNTISSNLNDKQRQNISNKIQTEITSKKTSRNELIEEAYNKAFGVNLNLENLQISNLIKIKNGTQYYPENSSNTSTIYLNKENEFSKMLLSNYYGAVNTSSTGNVKLKYWENSYATLDGRSERADTIYKDNFQTGDILIYQNVQVANDDVKYKTENGTYYLIYISEKAKITVNEKELYGFIGIDEKNEINQITTDRDSLQALLGKDYYVILRPSIELDIVPMQLDIKYSTTQKTNENVEVSITSNEEMLTINGWSLSSDRKTLKKTYTANETEKITVYDLAGNATQKTITIDNIDKEKPILNVNYSTTKSTNQNVEVTVKANEEIQEIEGWTLSEDKNSLTKTYEKNETEEIEIADIVGNLSIAKIDVQNIDKKNPIVSIEYNTTQLTKNDVMVTITANEEVRGIEGWQLSDDGKKVYKIYTQNTEEVVTIYDLAGNSIKKTVTIENIDKASPGYEIKYSTTLKTNENVVVTIITDEEIQEIEGWTLSENKKTLTKTYEKNETEEIEIADIVGNLSIAKIDVQNIDKENPIVSIEYNTTQLTKKDVIVTITANEEVREIEGWTLSENKKILTKTYTKNTEEVVTIYDLAGNSIKKTVTIENIDKESPGYEIKYSTTLKTNENVVVTIITDEEIQEIEGWTLSENKKTLTKIYSENTEETVVIKDLIGNEADEATIKINNIDKIAPEIKIEYSNKKLTNQDIIVTITANEEVRGIEGWTLSEDKKILTKTYTKNTEEVVTIYDLAGNSIKKTVTIENIDKASPGYEIKYSTTLETNEDVVVTIITDEEIQEIEGWTLSENKKTLTKIYSENTEETVVIKDLIGNEADEATIKIDNIDKIAPTLEILYDKLSETDRNVIVTIKANEKIQEVEGWMLSEDKKILTKTYTKNTEENVIIKDQAGNSSTAIVKVSSIESITSDTPSNNEIINDETISKIEFPNAGVKTIAIFVVVAIIICIAVYIKLKGFKDIK